MQALQPVNLLPSSLQPVNLPSSSIEVSGVVFSAPLYKCIYCSQQLVSNVLRFNPTAGLVLHLNAEFEAETSDLAHFVGRAAAMPRVFVNPERLNVSNGDSSILSAHVSNFRHAEAASPGSSWSRFAFLASNVLFLKPGYVPHVLQYDGISGNPAYRADGSWYQASLGRHFAGVSTDADLAALGDLRGGGVRHLLIESTFYTRDAVRQRLLPPADALRGSAPRAYPCEEYWVPTAMFGYVKTPTTFDLIAWRNASDAEQVAEGGDWHAEASQVDMALLNGSGQDKLFMIKRVPMEANASARRRVSELMGGSWQGAWA